MGVSFRSRAIFRRSSPRTLWTIFGLSAAKQSRSPSFAPVRSMSFAAIGARNLATPVSKPPAVTLVTARPLAPKPLAHSARASVSLRLSFPPPGTAMALTIAAFLKTPKSVCWPRSVMSCNFMPKRRSGRSEPYLLIASSYCMCGIGLGISLPRISFQIVRQQSLHDGDDVLAVDEGHFHVELGELRLPVGRGSSSRKQRTICMYLSQPLTIRSCLKSCGDCGSA